MYIMHAFIDVFTFLCKHICIFDTYVCVCVYIYIYIHLHANVLFCDFPFRTLAGDAMTCASFFQVILVSDPNWTHHPVGRAHWRLLWAVGKDGKMLGFLPNAVVGKCWQTLENRGLKPKTEIPNSKVKFEMGTLRSGMIISQLTNRWGPCRKPAYLEVNNYDCWFLKPTKTTLNLKSNH